MVIRRSFLGPPLLRFWRVLVEEKELDWPWARQPRAVHEMDCGLRKGEKALRRAVDGGFMVGGRSDRGWVTSFNGPEDEAQKTKFEKSKSRST